MSHPTTPEEDRVDDLKDAATDALKAINLALPDVTSVSSRAVLRDAARGLRAALDRFLADTQPLDPRDLGHEPKG